MIKPLHEIKLSVLRNIDNGFIYFQYYTSLVDTGPDVVASH